MSQFEEFVFREGVRAVLGQRADLRKQSLHHLVSEAVEEVVDLVHIGREAIHDFSVPLGTGALAGGEYGGLGCDALHGQEIIRRLVDALRELLKAAPSEGKEVLLEQGSGAGHGLDAHSLVLRVGQAELLKQEEVEVLPPFELLARAAHPFPRRKEKVVFDLGLQVLQRFEGEGEVGLRSRFGLPQHER